MVLQGSEERAGSCRKVGQHYPSAAWGSGTAGLLSLSAEFL